MSTGFKVGRIDFMKYLKNCFHILLSSHKKELSTFIIFTVLIPLVQMKIDEHTLRYDNFRFQYEQALVKHSQYVEKHDTERYLSFLLKDKYVQKHFGSAIFGILRITNTREHELLAQSLAISSLYPESSHEEYKKLFDHYAKISLTDLKTLDFSFDDNVIKIKNSIQKDKSLWNTIKIILYCFGSTLFLLIILIEEKKDSHT